MIRNKTINIKNIKNNKKKQFQKMVNFNIEKSKIKKTDSFINEIEFLKFNQKENKNWKFTLIDKNLDQNVNSLIKENSKLERNFYKNFKSNKKINDFNLINNLFTDITFNWNRLYKILNKNELKELVLKFLYQNKKLRKFLFPNDKILIKLIMEKELIEKYSEYKKNDKNILKFTNTSLVKYKEKWIYEAKNFKNFLFQYYKNKKDNQLNQTFNYIRSKNFKLKKLSNSISKNYKKNFPNRIKSLLDSNSLLISQNNFNTGKIIYPNIKKFVSTYGKFTHIKNDNLKVIKLNYKNLNNFLNNYNN